MSELTVPLFEAMLLSSVGNTNPDTLVAAPLSRVDVEALRAAVAKEERTKKQKRAKSPRAKTKSK
jgi:hypothetical protein